MTIREYIDNPMGRGDASIPNRRELINTLEIKYQNLIKKKGNQIKMNIYKTGNKTDDIYFHLIIPTETERTNSYDVVFKFSDVNRQHKQELSISKYDIFIFANSPSFAYTFAYVYIKNEMFIDILKPKLGKEITKHEPEIRNRFGIINYEKYVYFGARFIIDSKKMNRAFLDSNAFKFDEKYLKNQIRSLEVILAEYKKAASKLKNTKNIQEKRVISGKSIVPKTTVGKEIKKKTPKSKKGKMGKIRKI